MKRYGPLIGLVVAVALSSMLMTLLGLIGNYCYQQGWHNGRQELMERMIAPPVTAPVDFKADEEAIRQSAERVMKREAEKVR